MPFFIEEIKVSVMDYRKMERMAGLNPIPWVFSPFLFAGFLLKTWRFDAYKLWKHERIHLALHHFPPSDQWFSPLLSRWIGFKFWWITRRSQRWFQEVFTELCKEEGFNEFRLVKNVGWVKIEPGFVHIRVKEIIKGVEGWRTEFTLNESWPGKIYVHTRHTEGEWKLAYRLDWELRDTSFIPQLEELWSQIQKSQKLRNVIPIRKSGPEKSQTT